MSFYCDFEVFPAAPPRFVAGFYPLSGFEPFLEFVQETLFQMNIMHA
jgi:hypothetical protein